MPKPLPFETPVTQPFCYTANNRRKPGPNVPSGVIQSVTGMKRVIATLLSGLCLLTLAGCKQEQAKGPARPPIVQVCVQEAKQEAEPTEQRVVGTVEASAIVQMKSQIAGQLMRVGFTEGQNVARSEEHTSELQSLRHLVC